MTDSVPDLLASAGLQVFERGWLSANNILFTGADSAETVLVDTGYASHAEQTLALVRQGLGGRRLGRIVNTHLHSDHCGGNHLLQQAFDCAIDVPLGEAAKVDAWDEAALTYRDTGQQCPRFRRTGTVVAGGILAAGGAVWQVLAAPGHDPESVVLYQAERQILISADALWENGFGVVFPELEGDAAFEDVRATLELLSGLPVRLVIPGHGAPFTDVGAAIDRAYSRLDGFLADPRRHARYAAKVLIKFHLLEVQRIERQALSAWLARTRYVDLCRARYFPELGFEAWCDQLLAELATSGALACQDGWVVNR